MRSDHLALMEHFDRLEMDASAVDAFLLGRYGHRSIYSLTPEQCVALSKELTEARRTAQEKRHEENRDDRVKRQKAKRAKRMAKSAKPIVKARRKAAGREHKAHSARTQIVAVQRDD